MKSRPRASVFAMIGAATLSISAARQWNRIAEENAVIVAVIDSVYHNKQSVVLIDSTRSMFLAGEYATRNRQSLKAAAGTDSAMVSDAENVNRERRNLSGLIAKRVPFEIVYDSVLRNFPHERVTTPDGRFTSQYWEAFHARFPGRTGIIQVSRPGFNVDHSVAIVDIFNSCDVLCGYGGVFILRKIDGVWRIVSNPIMSVS